MLGAGIEMSFNAAKATLIRLGWQATKLALVLTLGLGALFGYEILVLPLSAEQLVAVYFERWPLWVFLYLLCALGLYVEQRASQPNRRERKNQSADSPDER